MTMEGYYRELDQLYAQLERLHRSNQGDRALFLQIIGRIRDLRQNHATRFRAPEP